MKQAFSAKRILPPVEQYVVVSEAAKMLGVSERSVYGYIKRRKLPALRLGGVIVLRRCDLASFQQPVAGRPRQRVPVWRIPVAINPQYLLSLRLRLKAGQQEAFQKRLLMLRVQKKHQFPGTVARYISHSVQDPLLIQITLVWRSLNMPSNAEREEALQVLRTDSEELFDWEHAALLEGPVDLNT